MVAMATYSYHRLIMEKVEIDIFCQVVLFFIAVLLQIF